MFSNNTKHTLMAPLLLVPMMFAPPLSAEASTLFGSSISIASRFNAGGSGVQQVIADAANAEITGGFSWMIAGDYFDLTDATNDFYRLTVHLSQDHIFTETDVIHIDFELPANWAFGPAALTKAWDVTVPSASIHGNVLGFDLAGLDQISNDFSGGYGEAVYKFKATENVSSVPVPGTLGLFAVGMACLSPLRRRAGLAVPKR